MKIYYESYFTGTRVKLIISNIQIKYTNLVFQSKKMYFDMTRSKNEYLSMSDYQCRYNNGLNELSIELTK